LRRRAKTAAAPAPNRTTIDGSGTSTPEVELVLDDPLVELLVELEVLVEVEELVELEVDELVELEVLEVMLPDVEVLVETLPELDEVLVTFPELVDVELPPVLVDVELPPVDVEVELPVLLLSLSMSMSMSPPPEVVVVELTLTDPLLPPKNPPKNPPPKPPPPPEPPMTCAEPPVAITGPCGCCGKGTSGTGTMANSCSQHSSRLMTRRMRLAWRGTTRSARRSLT
jgi:hypothetical protein